MSQRDGVGFEGVGAHHDVGAEDVRLESEGAVKAERLFQFAENLLLTTDQYRICSAGKMMAGEGLVVTRMSLTPCPYCRFRDCPPGTLVRIRRGSLSDIPLTPPAQVGFEDGKEGFSTLEMQIRDWNGTVRLSATLSPGDCCWDVVARVVTRRKPSVTHCCRSPRTWAAEDSRNEAEWQQRQYFI